jgi:hypothetical protein
VIEKGMRWENLSRYAFWPMMYALRPVALRKMGLNQAIITNLAGNTTQKGESAAHSVS